MKECKRCRETKPLEEFYENPSGRDGKRPECKECTKQRRKAWYAKNRAREIERIAAWQRENPDKVKANIERFTMSGRRRVSNRKSHLKRKYGMTLEDFETKLASQGGGCAICGTTAVRVDNIDHDHATGFVRGILCFRCNAAVGQLDDDPQRARALADYLDLHFIGDVIYKDPGIALVLQPS